MNCSDRDRSKFTLAECVHVCRRGLAGLGNFMLRDGLQAVPWTDVDSSVQTVVPEQIVENIRNPAPVNSQAADDQTAQLASPTQSSTSSEHNAAADSQTTTNGSTSIGLLQTILLLTL